MKRKTLLMLISLPSKEQGNFMKTVKVVQRCLVRKYILRKLGVKVHPSLKLQVYGRQEASKEVAEGDAPHAEEKEEAPITTLIMRKHRIDKNSMKIMFHCLQFSTIHTLK
jgi:hypothetical protein